MTAAPQPQQHVIKGIVKQVSSGDTIVIRGVPKGGPPKEKTVILSFITAPKLARRPQIDGKNEGRNVIDQDQPFAWDAREFLRKKLIGKNVICVLEKSPNTTREYATVYFGNDQATGENINETLVSEGLVTVKGDNMRSPPPEVVKLLELQETAKQNRKGLWDPDATGHKRTITWTVDKVSEFMSKYEGKPTKAIIEQVRDGSTVRAFLLPDFVYITIMMSGIRSPQVSKSSAGDDANCKVDVGEEARFFTEKLLLQQEVEIVIESYNQPNFVGTIIHPKGNIAEELLKCGLAVCVDWSIAKMKKSDIERYRNAEKMAKEKKLRQWKNWKPPPMISDNEFTGTVIEVINGDALNVKLPNGSVKKIFLASIRSPRLPEGEAAKPAAPGQRNRQLYDVPWMFEAREYLRKKLIGKKVNVTVDYIQPARDNMPEKCCCTVTIASVNVAEALVSKGLATVVRYRQDDDQRAAAYDTLRAAEVKAQKSLKGIHGKKDVPPHRINDYSGDPNKARALFPHIKRQSRMEALVEYVTSGSRLRLFLQKDSSLITFLLSGIDLKGARDDNSSNEDLALNFTRERCMQRDVEIKVESIDKVGNFIGWLWVENVNLSVALVENGLARVHASAEGSEFAKQFMNAKNTAKTSGLWRFIETDSAREDRDEDRTPDRQVDYKEVVVVVTSGINFYAQYTNQEGKLNSLQARLKTEMTTNPPLPGVYVPRKGEYCAAKFDYDGEWYRAKVERSAGASGKVVVHYIDYGNKAEVPATSTALLPSGFDPKTGEKPYAHQFTLALVQPPKDSDYASDMEAQFYQEVMGKRLLLNVELPSTAPPSASLVVAPAGGAGGGSSSTNNNVSKGDDIAASLIAQGLLLVEKRKERRLQKLVSEYVEAEEEAKKKRLRMWEYGDVREDDDKEFGMGR